MYNNLNFVSSEFKKKAKKLGYCKAWIFRAENFPKERQKILVTLDNIISQMPDTEKDKLAQRFGKIIPDDKTEFEDDYDKQFCDALVEVLGYGFLREKYPSHIICFEKPDLSIKKPDLIVRNDKGQLIAAMECKAIRHSDKDNENFRSRQGECIEVDQNILSDNSSQNPLLRKVKYTLAEAERQLARACAPAKFILVDFSWDLQVWLRHQEVKNLVQELAKELALKSIRLIAIENLELDNPFVCTEL